MWSATKKSGFAPTKFISNVVSNQALSWTIGSKPSANSKMGRCNARQPQASASLGGLKR
jgi:hypothetical protein